MSALAARGLIDVRVGARGGLRIASERPGPADRRVFHSAAADGPQPRRAVRGDAGHRAGHRRAGRRARADPQIWRSYSDLVDQSRAAIETTRGIHARWPSASTRRWPKRLATARCGLHSPRCGSTQLEHLGPADDAAHRRARDRACTRASSKRSPRTMRTWPASACAATCAPSRTRACSPAPLRRPPQPFGLSPPV